MFVRTRYLVAISISLMVIFFVPAIFYWSTAWTIAHYSPYRCMYGDPGCSLAIATYALCFLTGSAFLAAYYAGSVALKNLRLEQSRILVERIAREEPQERDQIEEYTLRGADLSKGEPPLSERPDLFEFQLFRFDSIGRAPIVDAKLRLTITLKEPNVVKEESVDIGSFACDGSVYVRLYVSKPATNLASVMWFHEPGPRERGVDPMQFKSRRREESTMILKRVEPFPADPRLASDAP